MSNANWQADSECEPDDDEQPAQTYDDSFGDGHCFDCGDPFHLDDCGGYNPPCSCGCGCCRSCHRENELMDEDDYDPYAWHDAEEPPAAPIQRETP